MFGVLALAGLGALALGNPPRGKRRGKKRGRATKRGAYRYRLAVTKAEAAIIHAARKDRMSKLQAAKALKRVTPVAQKYLPAAYQAVSLSNPRFTPMWLNKSEFDMIKSARSAAMKALWGARRAKQAELQGAYLPGMLPEIVPNPKRRKRRGRR